MPSPHRRERGSNTGHNLPVWYGYLALLAEPAAFVDLAFAFAKIDSRGTQAAKPGMPNSFCGPEE